MNDDADRPGGDGSPASASKANDSSAFHHLPPLRIALMYAIFGVGWILVTDALVDRTFPVGTSPIWVQTAKGLLYIGITALLVYWLARLGQRRLDREFSALRNAEREVRESETYLRALIDASPQAIISLDSAGRVLTWNRSAERVFGWSAGEVTGNAPPFVPDDALEEFDQLLRRVLNGERLSGIEIRRLRKDGSWIDLSLSAAPIAVADDEGRGRILAVLEDLTQRKDQTEILKRSERMLARAERAARLGSWEWHIASDTVTWSDELYDIFGLSPEEAPPSFDDHGALYPPEELVRLRAAVQETLEHGIPFEIELRACRSDGELFWAVSRGIAERAEGDRGPVTHLFGSFQDISDRKAKEIERDRLLLAIEHTREAVLITEADGAILYVNPSFERMTGYSRDEVQGRNPRLLRSGEQDEAFYREMWRTINAGRTWEGRIVNRRKDGRLYTEEMSISPVRESSGATVSYVAVKRDVTRDLQLEARLQQTQKLESIGRLAGGLAHDFNNALTVIRGHTELALAEVQPGDPLHEHFREIDSAATHSADLIRQLLSFARQQPVVPKVLDLNSAVSVRLEFFRRLIGENIELQWQPRSEVPPVRIDPVQVEQILTNLLVNARDAIDDVGTIVIETRAWTLHEGDPEAGEDLPPGDYTVLEVVDSGRGMDEATVSRVFEPFFTTKETGEGTGLGLATVYGIVKQNDGFIDARSSLDEGSTFRVLLPATREDAESRPQKPSTRAEAPTGSELVLLVEDEEPLRRIAERFLEKIGYRVIAASGAEEAVDLVRTLSQPIDLLLTDVVMPGMNGRQLHSLLDRAQPGVRCVYMSGYTEDVIAHRGVLESDVHFLQKPFTLAELANTLREALDR